MINRFVNSRNNCSLAVSLASHVIILFILGVHYLPAIIDFRPDLTAIIEELDEIEQIDIFEKDATLDVSFEETVEHTPFDMESETMSSELELFEMPNGVVIEQQIVNIVDRMVAGSMATPIGEFSKNALSGRKNKGAAVAQNGGSEGSERAVALALAWIADHQLPTGAWSYSQGINPNCRGKCRDTPAEDVNRSLVSATALALLPMLGAGMTHREGKYQRNVKAGLDYIVSYARQIPEGVILAEIGSTPIMYHHGLATIVVCEAAAMTGDRKLEKIAQGAVDYIVWAQDPIGGGWRYTPRQPGDTSGMGWNLMALKSAEMAHLRVPDRTLQGTRHFLDNVVGAEGGAKYGYLNNNVNDREGLKRGVEALTAIGLLGQMYLGWQKNHPALNQGTDYLQQRGPSVNNLYYSYYATQVMHHCGGEKWVKWNGTMRDELIRMQSKDGHEQGSWYATGGLLKSAGRLGSTSFATMILEVYYRHLPIYRTNTSIDDFPLQ